MKYCSKCGKEAMEEAIVCTGCGCPFNDPPSIQYKKIIPGRGFGISSMVMGILGVLYGFTALNSVYTMPEYTSISTGLPIILAVLALVFGSISRNRGYKKGQEKAGIVLGVVSLALYIITIIISAGTQ